MIHPMSRSRAAGLFALSALLIVAAVAAAQDLPARCAGLCRANRAGHFVARADLLRPSSQLDGDDLLALVNRSPQGALPPDYAPGDLVDLETMRPSRTSRCVPPRRQCLRRDAAQATRALSRAMREAGHSPHVSSAFRAYRVQCSTFLGWSERGGFCDATTASALPGHSQHQLGTTLDLFTYAWTNDGYKFRPGYGCSPGGRWIAEHAHEHGFVLPYPLHADYRRADSACAAIGDGEERIDPRTGYRYEPWHLRYVGVENARRYHEAWLASSPGTIGEITLEQWLRREHEVGGAVGAPVCDGCNCDRCATFDASGPCDTPAWTLDAAGHRPAAARAPEFLGASMRREGERVVLEVRVQIPQNTATQPPVITPASGAIYRRGTRPTQLASDRARTFAPLSDAYRIAIGFDARRDWPFMAALVSAARTGEANGINALIPAAPGTLTVSIPIERLSAGTRVRVGIAHGGEVERVAWQRRAP